MLVVILHLCGLLDRSIVFVWLIFVVCAKCASVTIRTIMQI